MHGEACLRVSYPTDLCDAKYGMHAQYLVADANQIDRIVSFCDETSGLPPCAARA